jgi:hypothetical protein
MDTNNFLVKIFPLKWMLIEIGPKMYFWFQSNVGSAINESEWNIYMHTVAQL